MFIKRKAYKTLSASAINIQSAIRGMAARNEYRNKKTEDAAIILQVFWNSYHDYQIFTFFFFPFLFVLGLERGLSNYKCILTQVFYSVIYIWPHDQQIRKQYCDSNIHSCM